MSSEASVSGAPRSFATETKPFLRGRHVRPHVRTGLALVLLVVALAGCTREPAPPTTENDGLATAEALYPAALRAARAIDPTVKLVAALAEPATFPAVSAGGRAPGWLFVFQLAVNPSDLEPTPSYGTARANATTGEASFSAEPPPGFRPRARAPDGRAWLPGDWRGSETAARALAQSGRADAVSLALHVDGCPTASGAPGPAWSARVVTSRTLSVGFVSATSGDACRATSAPTEAVEASLEIAGEDVDLERGGASVAREARVTAAAAVGSVTLDATSVPGWDGALPPGLRVTFDPPALAGEGASRIELSASPLAQPGKYTLFVHGVGEAGRSTPHAALVVRVR